MKKYALLLLAYLSITSLHSMETAKNEEKTGLTIPQFRDEMTPNARRAIKACFNEKRPVGLLDIVKEKLILLDILSNGTEHLKCTLNRDDEETINAYNKQFGECKSLPSLYGTTVSLNCFDTWHDRKDFNDSLAYLRSHDQTPENEIKKCSAFFGTLINPDEEKRPAPTPSQTNETPLDATKNKEEDTPKEPPAPKKDSLSQKENHSFFKRNAIGIASAGTIYIAVAAPLLRKYAKAKNRSASLKKAALIFGLDPHIWNNGAHYLYASTIGKMHQKKPRIKAKKAAKSFSGKKSSF